MRKELVYGMTAKELVDVIDKGSMHEVIELKKLIDLHPNAEEIHEEIVKEMMGQLSNVVEEMNPSKATSVEEALFGALLQNVIGEMKKSVTKEEQDLTETLREQLIAKKEPSLKEVLEKQLTQQDIMKSLKEQLQAQTEIFVGAKNDDELAREMKINLKELLQEQLGKKDKTATVEDVLEEVVERIYAIETNDEEMLLTASPALYHLAFAGHFGAVCRQFDVDFEYKPEYTTVILREVTDLLIEEGRSLNIDIIDGEIVVSIV